MTILIFIAVLSILIVVHELGHFLMARWAGVKVEEFALGFGPKLLSLKDGQGTEYCLCAIPLGGYVKMAGDERSKCQGDSGEFFSKSVGHRALIAFMGPAVNYVLAFVCFVAVFMLGFVDMEATSRLVPAKLGKVVVGSPAHKAGLKEGDMVTRIDSKLISNWSDMQETIAKGDGREIKVLVLRDQHEFLIPVVPEYQKAKDVFGKEHQVCRIGVQPGELDTSKPLVIRRYDFFGAVKHAGQEVYTVTTRTLKALGEIVTGQRSAKEGMTGLIGIFFIIKFAAGVGFSFLLYIVGVISASLAIFNLLPLIPLDGGHLVLLAIEKIRGKPLSAKVEDVIIKVGLAFLISLAVIVFYLDFERIGLIDKIVKLFHHG